MIRFVDVTYVVDDDYDDNVDDGSENVDISGKLIDVTHDVIWNVYILYLFNLVTHYRPNNEWLNI